MNLIELIEHLHLDLKQLDQNVINNEIIANYSDNDLVRLVEVFLRGIGSRHQIDGNTVYTLHDMCDYYREFNEFSRKQQVYIIQNVLKYWDQLSLESRAILML